MVTLALFSGFSSLTNNDKLPDVSKQLSLYSVKLYFGIVISRFSAVSAKTSFIWVVHFRNAARFLNAIAVPTPLTVTDIRPVTKI